MDRLARDSIAAAKAGMTYGKWKALHPNTEEGNIGPEKLCKICGRVIPTRHRGSGCQRRLYCSIDCAYEAQVESNRASYHKKKVKADVEI